MKRLLLALALLGWACAAPRSPHDLAMSSLGQGRTVRIDEGRAYGPDVEVDRYEDGYRGTWRGRTVDIRIADGRVQGALGTTPIDLHFVDHDGMLAVKGMMGGQLGQLELTSESLTGQFAGCGYDLHKTDAGAYRGFRCGAADTTVRLPDDWAERPAHERATFLMLMLTS